MAAVQRWLPLPSSMAPGQAAAPGPLPSIFFKQPAKHAVSRRAAPAGGGAEELERRTHESMSNFGCRLMCSRFAEGAGEARCDWFVLFSRFDRDASGVMTKDEFAHVLRRDLCLRADVLSESCLDALWRALDPRNRGIVIAAEFITFMRHNYAPRAESSAPRLCDAYDAARADRGGVHCSQRTAVLGAVAAALALHGNRCGDDWYAMAVRVDRDERRKICVDELKEMVRIELKVPARDVRRPRTTLPRRHRAGPVYDPNVGLGRRLARAARDVRRRVGPRGR
ncbi:hypothetical protein M885DRAFT_214940 [Pelagophyceae sp. CCMP2097]|nr:hypothetical protein M885DRAFT_214940 [Pelagophyceae sp. CCMP2097]